MTINQIALAVNLTPLHNIRYQKKKVSLVHISAIFIAYIMKFVKSGFSLPKHLPNFDSVHEQA